MPYRSTSLAITLLGVVANSTFAIHLITTWRSFKWDHESEYDGSRRVDGLKLFSALLAAYFAAASLVSLIGFVGILKNKRSYVRFYRDSSIADLVFTAFSSVIAAYSAFQPPIRTGLCEELSSQPDFLRDMVEFGLTLENCELWFERAVLLSFVIAVVLVGIRLHFLLTVSRYYSYVNRHPHHPSSDNVSLQRIYLLPPPPSTPNQSPTLYAPVTSLSPDAARDLRATATTAWISHTAPDSSQHSHSHRHRYHHPSTPRIVLPDNTEDKSLLLDV